MTVDQFVGTMNGATHRKRAALPAEPPLRGPQPTIVDWMRLAREYPDALVNTADAASIAGVEPIRVRRLIKAGVLKSVTKKKPHVLMLTDVLRYRLHKGSEEGGAS